MIFVAILLLGCEQHERNVAEPDPIVFAKEFDSCLTQAKEIHLAGVSNTSFNSYDQLDVVESCRIVARQIAMSETHRKIREKYRKGY